MKLDDVAIAIRPILLVFLISVFLFTLLFLYSLKGEQSQPVPPVIRECPSYQDIHLRETIQIIFSKERN